MPVQDGSNIGLLTMCIRLNAVLSVPQRDGWNGQMDRRGKSRSRCQHTDAR